MASRKTSLANFGEMLAEVLGEYNEKVDKAIAEGVEESAQIFIRHASQVSPKGWTGEYRNSWTTNSSKGKYRRYVGNAKTVRGKNNTSIPLINILEYSTVRGHKHVKKAKEESKADIFNCFLGKLTGV